MKLAKQWFLALCVGISLAGGAALQAAPAGAIAGYDMCQNDNSTECKNIIQPPGASSQLPTRVWNIVRTALMMIGGVAVIVIVIGGILYALSNGDANRAKTAKNTILYAVIGLIVAMSASAIITLVTTAMGLK